MFKVIKILATIIIASYAASLIYVLSFAWKTNIPAHADAAVILGAKVNLDNSPSDPLYKRTLEAINLYKQGKVDYIIATGGVGLGPTPESLVSGQIEVNQGVPANKILFEDSSHTTFQNIEDIKSTADKYKIKSVVIVSDRFHVARGVLVAKYFGFNPVYWDYPNEDYYPTWLLIQNYAREAAALLYYIPMLVLNKSALN